MVLSWLFNRAQMLSNLMSRCLWRMQLFWRARDKISFTWKSESTGSQLPSEANCPELSLANYHLHTMINVLFFIIFNFKTVKIQKMSHFVISLSLQTTSCILHGCSYHMWLCAYWIICYYFIEFFSMQSLSWSLPMKQHFLISKLLHSFLTESVRFQLPPSLKNSTGCLQPMRLLLLSSKFLSHSSSFETHCCEFFYITCWKLFSKRPQNLWYFYKWFFDKHRFEFPTNGFWRGLVSSLLIKKGPGWGRLCAQWVHAYMGFHKYLTIVRTR